MDLKSSSIIILQSLIPSSTSVMMLLGFFAYLAVAGSLLPGKSVPGVSLPDKTRLRYRCNGLVTLLLLVVVLGAGVRTDYISSTTAIRNNPSNAFLRKSFLRKITTLEITSNNNNSLQFWNFLISPTAIADRGLELLSATFVFSVLVTLVLYMAGRLSNAKSSSLKPHVTGNLIHDWWFGIQLNPQFMGIDLKFFFVRAGMMGWLLINLSVLGKSVLDASLCPSMILYQIFCLLYILDYFYYEEYMTSTWDIIAEHLGFMLVFGDLVWIPFTFSIQGWWLLSNKVELTTAAIIANCIVFVMGYRVFRGANRQKHVFKKDPKAPIWGRPPKVVGGKLLASGYWGIARHCNYLGDLLLALSFSLPCGISSPVPYFYPIYLLILLIWRERRDEARCAQKYKEVWAEYCKLVPWRILPYLY